MKRLLSIAAVAFALVATGFVTTGAAAYAASATNVDYLSDDCFNSTISVSGLDPNNDDTHIYVYAPNGAVEDEEVADDNQTSDTFTTELCQYSDPVGTYTVYVEQTPVATFSVAQPVWSLRMVHAHTKRATLQAQLTLRGVPLAGRGFKIEARIQGYWVTVTRRKTNAAGNFPLYCVRGSRKDCKRYTLRLNYGDFVYSRGFHLFKR